VVSSHARCDPRLDTDELFVPDNLFVSSTYEKILQFIARPVIEGSDLRLGEEVVRVKVSLNWHHMVDIVLWSRLPMVSRLPLTMSS
jgi:hypothetical protein